MAKYVKPSHPRLYDLPEKQAKELGFRLSQWEDNNPPGEFTRQPQLAAWIFATISLGLLLSSDGGLGNAAPFMLLGLPVVSFGIYFYFNSKLEEWQHKRDRYEANIVDEMLAESEEQTRT